MADLAKYVVSLEAETAKYRRELQKANRSLDKFTKTQTQKLDRVSAGFKRIGTVIATAFATGVITRQVRQMFELANQLRDVSIQFNIAASSLDAYRLIAERSGIQFNTLVQGMQRLQRRVAEAAEGTGEAQTALAELGLAAGFLNTLQADRQLERIARAFEGVENQADRVRLAFKLFDSEGVRFLRFLSEGEVGLKNLRRELADGGLIMSDAQIEQMAKANTELVIFGQRIESIARTVATGFMQGLASQFNGLLTLLERARGDVPAADGAEPESDTESFLRRRQEDAIAYVESLKIASRQLDEFFEKEASQVFPFDPKSTDPERFQFIPTGQITTQMDVIVQEWAERTKRMQAIGDAFSQTFADNLVQAMDGSFKGILRSWVATLQQMVARSIASGLFNAFAGTATGGNILGFLGNLPEFASGGVVPGPRGQPTLAVVHGGETVTPAGMGSNFTFNIQSGVGRAELAAVIPVIEERVKASVRDDSRRG